MLIRIALAFALLLSSAAFAQRMTIIGAGGVLTQPSGSCSNQLDFSAACNSQYVGVVL